MSEFDNEIIATRTAHLASCGESVRYKPKAGGDPRTILAVVTRGQPDGLEGAGYGHSPLTTIFVANDSTTGISAAEINTGGDEIEYAVRIGEDVTDRRITKIAQQDAGMLELELR